MDYGEFGLKVFEALSPVILLLVTWLSAELQKLISTKVKNAQLQAALLHLQESVIHTVAELEQTLVAAIRLANADGKITDEEKANLAKVALESVKNQLGTNNIAVIQSVLGVLDIDKFITTRIESEVMRLRKLLA